MFSVKKAEIYDILKISRVWVVMAKELDEKSSPNLTWWRERATASLQSGNYCIFFAEDGGKVLGFLDFYIYPEPLDSKIHAVGQHAYVLSECRDKGVFGKIYEEALKFVKSRGVEVIDLTCAYEEVGFWEKHEFKVTRYVMDRSVS